MTTREGFQWTGPNGLEAGVPSLGAIKPVKNIKDEHALYDVIVIGAGYAGLTAARDLVTTGHEVLLLEARDRIGGRTWSSNLDGYPFEMGGTWVHWFQPFVYREIARYGMASDLESSHDFTKGINCHEVITPHSRRTMSHDEEMRIFESALRKFVNVDGQYGREIVPMAHDPHRNPEVFKYDQMSFADRFREIEHDLTPVERANFEGFLSITSGGAMEDSSFFEFLRWWALNNYDIRNFFELCLTFKFHSGQSTFARKFFDEASSSKKFSWRFDCPVELVANVGHETKVTTTSGHQYKARRVICTVPLNVLHKINFSPPLSAAKFRASKLGHCNQVSKVHVECANPELRSFSATAFPHTKLTYIFGDGTTPSGNTHLVSFGSSLPGVHLHPEENIQDTLAAFQDFAPMDVRRIVFHNWSKDEFAAGAWEFLRPDMCKYIDALRERQGNIIFASADWALGWRGFIDGAIEDGTRAAAEVKTDLQSSRASKL